MNPAIAWPSSPLRAPAVPVHRWQPTGLTTCGRSIYTNPVNGGGVLDEGVTCEFCKVAPTRVSYGLRPHPGAYGVAAKRGTA